ncbi:hypothetical protein IV203_031600 [Nitzschia inconspicua]|uniref:Uncharacterized protein n=1 Tax=Nitzschia inconspicua TaxID=303405 RepID=A0A9K3LVH9_9STRA|nr:hypothetical protein IV203_031600 [Nitzschia inconspicua]
MQRFKYWCILCFCSIIYIVSVLDAVQFWRKNVDAYEDSFETANEKERQYYERWSISVAAVTTALSFCGILCWLLPKKKIIRRIEVLLIFLVVALNGVVATFATIKPSYTLSWGVFFFLVMPNVFLFGWICVFAGILLLANWVWHEIQHEEGIATVEWILLGSTSFVVMISALAYRDSSLDTITAFLGNQTSVYKEQIQSGTTICELSEKISCSRVALAIVLGAISASTATSVAAWKNAPQLCQSELSFLLLVAWIAGVALLTFDTGPGQTIGNIYCGTWLSLLLSLNIFFRTIKAAQEEESSSPGNEIVEDYLATSMGHDDFFGVAHDRLEIQVAGWSSGRRGSLSTSRIRKGLSSVMFSSIGEWNWPRETMNTNDGPSQVPALDVEHTSNGKSVQAKRHKLTRLEFWIILMLLSSVCLSALFSISPSKGDRERYEIFALATPSLSIALSFCGYITCLMPQNGARYAELVLGFLEVFVWTAGAHVLSRIEETALFPGVNNQTEPNSNVMLSTWGAFIMSLLLITSWWKASLTVTYLVLLVAFSFAMMLSSIFAYRDEVTVENDDGSYTNARVCAVLSEKGCDRILLGQYLGMASGIVSLIMIAMTKAPVLAHVIISALLFTAWAVGVSLIAYGSGHGASAGDVFLEVWMCFFLSLDIMTSNIAICFKIKDRLNDAVCSDENLMTSTTRNKTLTVQSSDPNQTSGDDAEKDHEASEPGDAVDFMPEIAEPSETTTCDPQLQ